MDNARTHNALVIAAINGLRNRLGEEVKVVFQPAYSPDVNWAEMVFGMLDLLLVRDPRSAFGMLPQAIFAALAEITPGNLKSFARHSYYRC